MKLTLADYCNYCWMYVKACPSVPNDGGAHEDTYRAYNATPIRPSPETLERRRCNILEELK